MNNGELYSNFLSNSDLLIPRDCCGKNLSTFIIKFFEGSVQYNIRLKTLMLAVPQLKHYSHECRFTALTA